MKVKLDENLPTEVAALLTARGHDVHTVPEESLTGQTDAAVFRAAANEGRIFFTQDLDFSDVRRFAPGTHPGIVLVRLRDPSRQRLTSRLAQVIDSEGIETWGGCFVVIGDAKWRIRQPKA